MVTSFKRASMALCFAVGVLFVTAPTALRAQAPPTGLPPESPVPATSPVTAAAPTPTTTTPAPTAAPPPSNTQAPAPSSGISTPASADRPPPFDPTAPSASGPTTTTLQPGADLDKGPAAPGDNGYPASLTPPPGVPAESRVDYGITNPALLKIGAKETYAIIRTSYGAMTIKLFSQYAPQTVRNFIELAKGVKEFSEVRTGRKVARPFYNGLIFHRVIPGFIVQTGCPFGNGRGGPGYAIKNEIHPALRHSRVGVVSMANELDKGKPKDDSAGSQFFITLSPRPEFDGKYTVFGQVTQGLDVLDKIGNAKTGPTDRPVRRILLQTVEIVDK